MKKNILLAFFVCIVLPVAIILTHTSTHAPLTPVATITNVLASPLQVTVPPNQVPAKIEAVTIPPVLVEENIRTNSIRIIQREPKLTSDLFWTVYTVTDGIDTIRFSDSTDEAARVLGAPGMSDVKLEMWKKVCLELRDEGILPASTRKVQVQYATRLY